MASYTFAAGVLPTTYAAGFISLRSTDARFSSIFATCTHYLIVDLFRHPLAMDTEYWGAALEMTLTSAGCQFAKLTGTWKVGAKQFRITNGNWLNFASKGNVLELAIARQFINTPVGGTSPRAARDSTRRDDLLRRTRSHRREQH